LHSLVALLFFSFSLPLLHLPSFPTRRSSDLTLTISAPNEFARDWLEGRYTTLISDIVLGITGARLSIKFVVPDSNVTEKDPKPRSEEHTSELQSRFDLVCRLLLEKKK